MHPFDAEKRLKPKRLQLCLLGLLGLTMSGLCGVAHAGPGEKSGFDLTLERAVELHEAGGFDAAIQMYRSLLQDRPGDPRLLYELARSSLAVKEFTACGDYARGSAASISSYQPRALAVLARCELEGGSAGQALATYARAVQAHPEDAILHFEYAQALRAQGRELQAQAEFRQSLRYATTAPTVYLEYANVLAVDGDSAGTLLMNLRFIMTAPQSPQAAGAAERVLALLQEDPSPTANPDSGGFDSAYRTARLAALQQDGAASQAGQLSEFLQQFILNVVDAADEEMTASPLWEGTVAPMLSLAEHDVLDAYLYFVAALARTEGSPEWLSAHRQKFQRLVEYLARAGAS